MLLAKQKAHQALAVNFLGWKENEEGEIIYVELSEINGMATLICTCM
jgi:hypothetical protein